MACSVSGDHWPRGTGFRWCRAWIAGFVLCMVAGLRSHAEPAIVYDLGGKFDHSFNESAYRGAKRWTSEHGGHFAEFELINETQREQALRFAAEVGFDPIVAVGFAAEDAVAVVADEFPDSHFVLLDDDLEKPNVRSIRFNAADGSFLVGILAAMASKSGIIGFIGGMDSPLVRSYGCGYRQGAMYVNPNIQVIDNFVGTTPDAWKDPTKGDQLARSQFSRNADVIYAAAGGSGIGVLQAAADAGKLAIGVDSNQNDLHPGTVLTSMVNRLDNATYDAFEAIRLHSWRPGVRTMGLADHGVDWILDQSNAALVTAAMRTKVDAARQLIVSGALKVVDYSVSNRCTG
jgi:basic membrane protein A and related proteins